MDVLEDGSLLPNLTLSMVLPVRGRTSARELFSEKGPAAEAMALLEGVGAADRRWRLIPDATVARLVPVPVPEEEPVPVIMAVLPKFIKMKWNQGQLQTAKVYYVGRTEPVLDDGNMDRTRRGC